MGYHVDMELDVFIPKDKVVPALDTLCGLTHLMEGEPKLIEWVGTKGIIEAFRHLGYAASQQEKSADGGIYVTEFWRGKLLNDYAIWCALAPYVADGSSIYCTGDEQSQWKWTFKNSVCEESWAHKVWGAHGRFANEGLPDLIEAIKTGKASLSTVIEALQRFELLPGDLALIASAGED